MSLGIIFAFLTILLFGSWAVPTKTLEIDPKIKAFWLTIGHFLLSSVIFVFAFQLIPVKEVITSLIAGILWGVGILSAYVGIKHLGITRAIGIWIPVVIIVSATWGFLFFGEAKILGPEKLLSSIFGIILLIIAALAIIASNKRGDKLGNIKIGILAALLLGVLHGSYFIPLRVSNLPIFVTFLPLTIGMIIATSFAVFTKKLPVRYDLTSTFRMILSGLILGAGNYTALLTIQYLGVSQGYPLTQLAIIVNTLWGILFFKEVTTLKGKIVIAVGVILAIIGAIILNSAKI